MKKVISSRVCAEGFTPVMVDSKKSTVKDYGQSLRRVNVNDIHNPYLQILQGSGKSEKKNTSRALLCTLMFKEEDKIDVSNLPSVYSSHVHDISHSRPVYS